MRVESLEIYRVIRLWPLQMRCPRRLEVEITEGCASFQLFNDVLSSDYAWNGHGNRQYTHLAEYVMILHLRFDLLSISISFSWAGDDFCEHQSVRPLQLSSPTWIRLNGCRPYKLEPWMPPSSGLPSFHR